MKFKHLHDSLNTFERDARIFAVQTRHEPSNSVKKAKQWLLENHSEANDRKPAGCGCNYEYQHH
jgi:hypothetical protein